MEYRYRYRVRPSDVWQVRMYYAYASYTAVVNIICIVSSIALITALWRQSASWLRILMLLFLSLFTVIQPLLIYSSCKKQIKDSKEGDEEMELLFNDKGLTITRDEKEEKHPWKDIVAITRRPTLVIVYTGNNRGYILTNRILKETREDFLSFLKVHYVGNK